MNRWAVLFAAIAITASAQQKDQEQYPSNQVQSGQTYTFYDRAGSGTITLEYAISGASAISVSVQGCSVGGTCVTLTPVTGTNPYTGTTSTQVQFLGGYANYKVTPTFTGGSIGLYKVGIQAKLGSSSSGGVTAGAVTSAIQTQSGCTTAGYVWVPASGTCVAPSGGALPANLTGVQTDGSGVASQQSAANAVAVIGATPVQNAVTAASGGVSFSSGPQSVQQQTPLPTYYVDSVNGNDALAGTSQATAWKTIAKVNTAVASTSSVAITQQVAFKSNGRWAEQLNAVSGVRYTWYGTAGTRSVDALLTPSATNMPIIDGSDVVPGAWTSLGTGTYSATWASTVTKGYVDALYSQTTPLALIGTCTVGNVQATAGSVCATGGTIYVHLLDNSNPTAHTIAVSGARSYGINLGAAAFVEVNGLEVIRTAKSGIVMYNAGNPTGSGNVIKGNVLFNNFDTVGDAAIGGLIGGPIAMFGGFAQSPEPGVLVQDNYVGRTDWTPNSVQYLIAGISVNGMLNPQVIGNKVATVNGWAILAGDYYGAPSSGCYVAGNEMANFEGALHAAGCANAIYTSNYAHDGLGNGVQAGQSNVGDATHNGNGLQLINNTIRRLRPAYANGLYNGIDVNYVQNGIATGNIVSDVASFSMTLEDDGNTIATASSGWKLTNNIFDASNNVSYNNGVCGVGQRCGPLYMRDFALNNTYGKFLAANTFVFNPLTPVMAMGGSSAGDISKDLNEAQFDANYPLSRINTIAAITAPVAVQKINQFYAFGDSYDYGQGGMTLGKGFVQRISNETPALLAPYNGMVPGAIVTDIAKNLFANFAPHPTLPSVVEFGAGENDYTADTCGKVANTACTMNFQLITQAAAAAALPPQQHILASTATGAGWATDTTVPINAAYTGTAVTTTTSGSAKSFAIPANTNGLVILRVPTVNAGTGTFTVSIDGTLQTTPTICGGTTTFSAGPCAGTAMASTPAPQGYNFTVTPNTAHTLVVTTTNAAAVKIIDVAYTTATMAPNYNAMWLRDAGAAYDTGNIYAPVTAAVAAQYGTYGQRVFLLPARAAMLAAPGAGVSTSITTASSANGNITCAASTSGSHPSDCGHDAIYQAWVASEAANNYQFSQVGLNGQQAGNSGVIYSPFTINTTSGNSANLLSNLNGQNLVGGGVTTYNDKASVAAGINYGKSTSADGTANANMQRIFGLSNAGAIIRTEGCVYTTFGNLPLDNNYTCNWSLNGLTGSGYFKGSVTAPRYSLGSATNVDSGGTITMTGGTGTYTFTGTYTNAPICTSNDTTAIAAVRVSATNTVLTLSGTSGDVANYNCFFRP